MNVLQELAYWFDDVINASHTARDKMTTVAIS